MSTKIELIKAEFESELALCSDSESIEKIRVGYLGKKGKITELLGELKNFCLFK